MGILDYIMIGIIGICFLVGFKKGFISTIVAFIGTIVVFILAFYLKNPISAFLYEHLPLIKIAGIFKGVPIISILIYEGISYIITLTLLGIILGLIIKISGLFNKLVHSTMVLTIPSKLLGSLVGIVEGIMISFILVFVLGLILPHSKLYNTSKYSNMLLTKTPVLSDLVKGSVTSVKEVYDICTKHEKDEDKNAANIESLNILLKYEILSTSSAEKLVDSGKLKIEGAKELIENYKKGQS